MRTIVELTDEQIEDLRRYCEGEGVSRAEAVRRGVDLLLKDKQSGDGDFSKRSTLLLEVGRVTESTVSNTNCRSGPNGIAMTDEPMLFDSNIVIDALNGVEAGRQELRTSLDPSISIISWIEVLAGCPTPEAEAQARSLLASMAVLSLNDEIAESAVAIRRASRLKLPDAVILATARVHGLTLSTRNTRDFRADFPEVRIPYQL